MSQEVFEILKEMNMEDIQLQLALQCAPLIAGLKISNLLIVPKKNEMLIGAILRRTGISFYKVLTKGDKCTFLLFRRNLLEEFLQRQDAKEIFSLEGYRQFTLDYVLSVFAGRYHEYMTNGGSFPHEIGLLLGYPIEDVKGFMEHEGKNFLHCGYWKVYDNAGATVVNGEGLICMETPEADTLSECENLGKHLAGV